jgi:hypothetical protein
MLNRKGPAAYSEQKVRQIVEGTRARELSQGNRGLGGFMGIGGKGVVSDAPLAGGKLVKRTFGDVYVFPDGTEIEASKLRGDSGFLGTGLVARPNQNFRNIIQQ